MRKFSFIAVVLLGIVAMLGVSGCQVTYTSTTDAHNVIGSTCPGSCPNPVWAPQQSSASRHHSERRIAAVEDRVSSLEAVADNHEQRIEALENQPQTTVQNTTNNFYVVAVQKSAPPPQERYEQPAPVPTPQYAPQAYDYDEDGFVPFGTAFGTIMVSREDYGRCREYYNRGGRGYPPVRWHQPRQRGGGGGGQPITKTPGAPGGGGSGSSPSPVGGGGQPGRFSTPSRGSSAFSARSQSSGGFRGFAGSMGRAFSGGGSRGGGGRR